ncbi:MAG: M28 family peptidase [Jaaginema sp. PMC 1079.18]|nr:M28 family peptidase [Jaaginema sp. PMC 1080.18]MEC4853569.1 M28 family peptidase [Jaaginema sp. PMC 1079.18]MEC4866746.1 M28 family peptidase [Jaaginema sp. PMC 1078.18]
MLDYQQLFQTIAELVLCHSPSGVEQEVDNYLRDRLSSLNLEFQQDPAGNLIITIPGQNPNRAIAITAHKDEIGAIVKKITPEGCLSIRKLGGSFPWVYGEGVVDILGDKATIPGILSFGSRHVSHESPQKALQEDKPLTWQDAWVETKCSLEELTAAGIRPGTRVVVGKHRKHPLRLKNHIASYTLDNKASVAILLTLAQRLKNPPVTVYLVASAKEEVGAVGALYFSQNQPLEAMIALEICPLSQEYPLEDSEAPVLLSQDAYGIYDEGLNAEIAQAAQNRQIPLQIAVISGFGSDASIAMKFGHVARGACLSFPTQNTHGYEIAHLGAISHCVEILEAYCNSIS